MKIPFIGNSIKPGGVSIGPQMWSNTIVNMSADPVIDAVKAAVPKIERAIEKLNALETDEALQEFEEVLELLLQGLPPTTKINNGNG